MLERALFKLCRYVAAPECVGKRVGGKVHDGKERKEEMDAEERRKGREERKRLFIVRGRLDIRHQTRVKAQHKGTAQHSTAQHIRGSTRIESDSVCSHIPDSFTLHLSLATSIEPILFACI